MIKLLMLPRYGPLGASSRLRSLQYVPLLQGAGFQVDVMPLLSDSYVAGLYAGKISAMGVALSYCRRLIKLLKSRRYDLLWAEKELFPWLPAAFDLSLIPKRTALIVDYDDAVFHRYDEHPSWLVRATLGTKIDAVMQRANLVTAGNDYLAQRAVNANSRRVEWLPTVVDLGRYSTGKPTKQNGQVVVGWIGSPSTAAYLKIVGPALSRLATLYPLRCVAIGARPDQVAGTPFEALPWTEATEVNLLQQIDIGIMPLPDAPWERGKCGYKLIQYMACGLPVVASPVGVNKQIVVDGHNGFLATTEPEWGSALTSLVVDAALRKRMGTAGRKRVEEVYCLNVQAPRLFAMLNDVLRSNR